MLLSNFVVDGSILNEELRKKDEDFPLVERRWLLNQEE